MSVSDTNEKLDIGQLLDKYAHGQPVVSEPTEGHMHNVLERYLDAINQHDTTAMLDLYADDAQIVDPIGGTPISGKEAIKSFLSANFGALSDAKLLGPIRTSVGRTAAMPFSIEMDTGDQKVRLSAIDVMHFDEAGKIALMEAHWGLQDVKIIKGEMGGFVDRFLPSKRDHDQAAFENGMRESMQLYIDSIKHKNPTALLDMYVDEVVLEDPAGTAPIRGRSALAAFYEQGMADRVTLNGPIRASFGRSAAMAFTIEIDLGGQHMTIETIDVMKFDEVGKIVEIKAYWGERNVSLSTVE